MTTKNTREVDEDERYAYHVCKFWVSDVWRLAPRIIQTFHSYLLGNAVTHPEGGGGHGGPDPSFQN